MEPLGIGKDWEEIKKCYEAWWDCSLLDRVPLWVTAPRKGSQQGRTETLEDGLETAEDVLDKKKVIDLAEKGMSRTFYGGLAFPCFSPNFGTDVFSAYLGAELKFTPKSGTISWANWKKPILRDYSDLSILEIKDDNFYWKKTKEFTSYALTRSGGKYIVGVTDIHASIDSLSVLRGGPQQLCIDLIENPCGVKEAMKYLWKAWHKVYDESYKIIREKQEGTTSWIQLWSPGKSYPVQNDLSCLISNEMYREFFLEELVNEIEYLDHSIYHLDGVGALKHLDMLLDIPKLNAIQWVPGAGELKNGIAKWLPLYKKIQSKKKAIIVYCEPDEVDFIIKNLSPEGLLISVSCSTEEEAKRLLSSYKGL